MTGIVTASWMPLIMAGSLMRATPPSRRMSDGTRSSAMTAAAPASSAILACSASTTSMITPPSSIRASPTFTANVASSRMRANLARTRPGPGEAGALLETKRLDAVLVALDVAAVDAVGERLDQRQQGGVRPHVRRAVGRVVQTDAGELRHLGQR